MKTLACVMLVVAAAWVGTARAEVTVEDAWVRGTVPAQKATGAFMVLQSTDEVAVISAASPVAKMVEIHETRMEKDVMKMRAVPKVDLPAGRRVEFKPGGYHVMLMDLQQQLKKGDKVPLTLRIQGKDQKVQEIQVQAEVRDLRSGGSEHDAKQHKY